MNLMHTHYGRRRDRRLALIALCLLLSAGACVRATGDSGSASTEAAAVAVTLATAVEQPVTRFIRVSGTLTAQEDADVAAEIAGRIVATPIERGTRVGAGGELVRIAAAEVRGAGQGSPGQRRPDRGQTRHRRRRAVRRRARARRSPTPRPTHALAKTDFERVKMLFERQLLSQSEFDQRRAQVESAERQYDVARNGAEQQYQALHGRPGPRRRGAEGRGRHRRARAVRRCGRRALRLGRRLRHARHQGGVGDAHRSAARRAHGARAVSCRRLPPGGP